MPASSVENANKSIPAVVNVGATPPGHLIPANQLFVTSPPLVYSIKKLCTRPDAGGFNATQRIVPVPAAVIEKQFAKFKFNDAVVGAVTVYDPDSVILISLTFNTDPELIDPVIIIPDTTFVAMDAVPYNDPVISAVPSL